MMCNSSKWLSRLLLWHIAMAVCVLAFPLRAQTALPKPAAASDGKRASLSGTILTDVGEKPIPNAEIVISELNLSARSDTVGQFRLSGIPVGQHQVIVRRVGYEPYGARLTFRAAQHDEVDFLLREVSTKLKEIAVKGEVNARYAIRLAEFEERRKFGIGRFLTSDVFEDNAHRTLDGVMRSYIPGIRTIGKSYAQVLASTARSGGVPCNVQIVLNGINRYNGVPGQQEFDINSLQVNEVIGFEYYTVATTPLEYRATAGRSGAGSVCGTAVIWTK